MSEFPFRAAIFDLDGTLIDSMVYWQRLLGDFLARRGIAPDAEAERALGKMTISQGAFYIKNRFCPDESAEAIQKEIEASVFRIYAERCGLKPGAEDYLKRLKEQEIPMGIATITAKKAAIAVLRRLGIGKYFSCVLTDADVGKGKTSPDLYLAVAQKLRYAPEDCAVFEDSLGYARVAKAAGFRVYAVKDVCNGKEFEAFCAEADGVAPW